MNIESRESSNQESMSNSELVSSFIQRETSSQNRDVFLMPYKVCPFLATNFGSPNLHFCSILRSRDGSCCKVKIIAVILGEPTQTDNSWHKQMWSTEDAARLCWCHPCASLFLPTDKGYISSQFLHST